MYISGLLAIALLASIFINIFLIIDRKLLISLSKKLEEGFVNNSTLTTTLQKSTSNLNTIISDNSKLRTQINELLDVIPGDRIIIEQPLSHTDTKNNNKKHDFKVTYECEILETTKNKFRVKAIDFNSTDSYTKNIRQSIIDYYVDKWVDRSDCEIIIDQRHRRDSKLEDLLHEN